MKRFLVLVALLMSFSPALRAQVTVDCALEQKAYLANEDLIVKVRVSNFTGRTLPIGADPGWLVFSIVPQDGGIAPQIGAPPVQGEFELTNSKVATKRVDIAPYYELKPGRYTLVATVHVPGYEAPFKSAPRVFDIVTGTTMWETVFGMPSGPEAGESRRYVLQKGHLGKDMKLFLRLTDGSGSRTFRVFPLGGLVSFSSPEKQLDETSRLHVLHQYGARAFNYAVVSPDGELIKQERYDMAATRPTLKMNSEGEIIVVGGVKKAIVLDREAVEEKVSKEAEPATNKPDDKPATE
ncbi:MAG TPA: hypothetical protein VEH27_15075 [Methylomirabilota bacterium]|nr:hypothetical protein [Methylomirabilota bacterium]